MKYFVLFNPRFADTAFAYGEEKEDNFNTGLPQYCDGCGNPISMLEWLPPLDVKLSKKTLGDLIFGTFTGFIVSEKFKVLYEQTDLTGLQRFRKVNLYYRKRLLTEEYYYPEILILNAFIDLNRIEFMEKNLCDTCQKGKSILSRINGISLVKPDEINSDIFYTSSLGQATIIVSQNFKEFIDNNHFSNVKLVEASAYKWDSLKPIQY